MDTIQDMVFFCIFNCPISIFVLLYCYFHFSYNLYDFSPCGSKSAQVYLAKVNCMCCTIVYYIIELLLLLDLSVSSTFTFHHKVSCVVLDLQ